MATLPPAGRLDERTLVAGLVTGDRDAVSDFLDRTHTPVYAMACRLTTDHDLRQDWTHDVLLHVLAELERRGFVYRWPGCFWSWFRTRARYLLLDQLAAERRRRERNQTGQHADALLDDAADTRVDLEHELQRTEIQRAFEACVESLPNDDHQTALRLALVDELQYQEIADHMTASLNTIRSWIRRARIAVRRCMAVALGLDAEER